MTGMAMLAAMLLAGVPAVEAESEALRPGTVVVELPADAALPAAARQRFADAVERALSDARFVALPAAARSRYIARVKLTRTARGAVAADARERRASGNVGNWGAGLNVTMPSNKTELRGLIVTELEVELVRREGMQPVWRGRALTAQAEGTRNDAPEVLAPKLAAAAIRGFPAEQTEAMSVP